MKTYQIEYNNVITWAEYRIFELSSAKQANGVILSKAIRSVQQELFHKNNILQNEGAPNLYIANSDLKFPSAFALQLLQVEIEKIQDCLEYHSGKFEHNDIIKEANFEKFLDVHVIPLLEIYAHYLGITKKDLGEKKRNITEYFNKVTISEEGFFVAFNFSKNQKNDIIAALSTHVAKKDVGKLDTFLSENAVDERIYFTEPAVSIVDLFKRLVKKQLIRTQDHNSRQIARWLSNRILVKQKGISYKPGFEYLYKLFKQRNTKPPRKRLLVDLITD